MQLPEFVSLTASIASLILGLVAIWLSILFYRMSAESSRQEQEAAKEIEEAVDRLQALFNSLYNDTFSMMRDTVADMRRHVWGADADVPKVNAEADLQKLRETLSAELKTEMTGLISDRLGDTDSSLKALNDKIDSFVSKAVSETRDTVESFGENAVKRAIRNALLHYGALPMMRLLEVVKRSYGLTTLEIEFFIDVLFGMREDGLVSIVGPGSKGIVRWGSKAARETASSSESTNKIQEEGER